MLTLDEYQAQALKSDKSPKESPPTLPLLGLFGEVGSLLAVAKKKQRDTISYLGYAPHVIEELGDVLWYMSIIASRAGISLSALAPPNSIGSAHASSITFRQLQAEPSLVSLQPTPAFEATLIELGGSVGAVLSMLKDNPECINTSAFRARLGASMHLLLLAANEAGVLLETAASENLRKNFDRWPIERKFPEALDAKDLLHEKLPRLIDIEVYEREVAGKSYVFQQCNGLYIGDRLTDNAAAPDDYRFHDVFHFAYWAVLSWSPVVRSLLRLKRKSKPEIDETQDGARAILIEEGITTWIFGQAKAMAHFEGIKRGELSFDLLKAIRQFVRGYEPEQSPLWLWEEAILQGYEAFRFLKANRRARLRIDMIDRQLTVMDLPYDP